jgi:hypothetical protein
MMVLGRIGLVFIAAGLALVLLSLIPPREVKNSDFMGALILQPKTFLIETPFYLSRPFDPQRGLYINARANNSVRAYLLSVGKGFVYEWITSHFLESQPSASIFNLTVLEEFLADHPHSVAWQEEAVDGRIEFRFAPTKLMNLTLIFSNPGVKSAKVSYNGKLLSFIVPNERALNPAKLVIPTGLILALPWLSSMRKRKRIELQHV